MKKNILFVVTYFDCGGINRSLQNLLNLIDVNKYDVDVFAMVPDGMFAHLYKNCHVLPRHILLSVLMARYKQQKGINLLLSLIIKGIDRLTKRRLGYYIKSKVAKSLMVREQYDTVVAFSEGAPTAFVRLMNHPNSVAWIHCDYASYMKVGTGVSELGIYEKIKKIVCVSEYTRSSFAKIYPSLAERTRTIYNIIDDEMMQKNAKESITESFDKSYFNIVSVGRIDPVKRLSAVPELARKVTDAGCRIHWYVIGPKGSDDELKQFNDNIKKYDAESIVLPLGEKANPYPFISKADLLVNTSISEACPYVVNEAKILGTPVVCTDFGSAKEFIDYGENGYYEPIERMAGRIIQLINHSDELKHIRESLNSFTYNNEGILRQIDELILN